MTAKHKAELRGYVTWSTSLARVVLFAIAVFCLASLLRYLVEHTKPGAHWLWWLIPSLLVMALLYYRSGRWTGGPEFRRRVKADLEQGSVAAHHIDVIDAIEVEEREDEGPSYFVKTADGQVMLFTGQYLDAYKRHKFPWKSFELVEAPTAKVFFGLKRLGEPVTPSFLRQPFDGDEVKRYGCEKHQVVEVDFDSLKTKQAQSGSANVPPAQR